MDHVGVCAHFWQKRLWQRQPGVCTQLADAFTHCVEETVDLRTLLQAQHTQLERTKSLLPVINSVFDMEGVKITMSNNQMLVVNTSRMAEESTGG